LAVADVNDVGSSPAPTRLNTRALVNVTGSLVTGTSPTQDGRIFRDGIPSACPSKVYPGIFNVGTTYNYETFTLYNNAAMAVCATINFDPNTGASPCATNAHMSAYIGSYDPANQAANYVGDVGSSVTQSFAFDVPAGSAVVLVVTNTANQATCDFGFSYDDTELSAAVAGVPTLGTGGLAVAMLAVGALGAAFAFRRRGGMSA
jgi:hypothetical protein